MVGGPMKLAVNQFIASNPTAALEVAGGLVAVGAGLTLAHIMKVIGVKESDLPEGGMREVELLDAERPDRFFNNAATSLWASLAEWEMRGDLALPQMGWRHGPWSVRHRVHGFVEIPFKDTETAHGCMVTDVETPVMDESGKLV